MLESVTLNIAFKEEVSNHFTTLLIYIYIPALQQIYLLHALPTISAHTGILKTFKVVSFPSATVHLGTQTIKLSAWLSMPP